MFNIYKGKKVLITGHTGFKGSWLSLMLNKLGAEVKGYSDGLVSEPNHYFLLNKDHDGNDWSKPHPFSFVDIREKAFIEMDIDNFKPDIIFHLSAQPIVLKSYENPMYTFETNFMGTLNLLEACRNYHQPQAIIVITTDKVYENFSAPVQYKETDRLMGYDPYSTSKVCVEHLVDCYRKSYFKDKIPIATARAGNVIGGGDFAENRLVPDIVKAIHNKEKLVIRNINAIRPWQFVLDCLSGYLKLGERLLDENYHYAEAWNFGPDEKSNIRVGDLLSKIKDSWIDFDFICEKNNLRESQTLMLNSSKANLALGWKPKYDIDQTIEKTIEWYKEYYENGNVITEKQIEEYLEC